MTRPARLPAALSALRCSWSQHGATCDNDAPASPSASVGHASACHGAFAVAAVHREHTSGRVPQGWRLLLTRVDSREDCPSSGPFSRHAVLLPQAHVCHCLKRPFLTVRGNWFLPLQGPAKGLYSAQDLGGEADALSHQGRQRTRSHMDTQGQTLGSSTLGCE